MSDRQKLGLGCNLGEKEGTGVGLQGHKTAGGCGVRGGVVDNAQLRHHSAHCQRCRGTSKAVM